jgi:hypothetical protein
MTGGASALTFWAPTTSPATEAAKAVSAGWFLVTG